jgi:methylenetetrahydrofolate--tRNA-(uracil-5-)-methyltransferase
VNSAITEKVVGIGAGLAGCEAAWQLAQRGVPVELIEMKPGTYSPAHQSPDPAELVCSNSLRGAALSNAVGLLKEEMRRLDSFILRVADETAVPAGNALAVDRVAFSKRVGELLASHSNIQFRREEVRSIPKDPWVLLATGPLTAAPLASELQALLGEEHLSFYDAISPIIHADSIDLDVVFRASRYDEEGDGDYLNVPLGREQYIDFVNEVIHAETMPLHSFENAKYFEGCLPIEVMAHRGVETLSFGPMKPVGLTDPRTGKRPYAVIQLRQEDREGLIYNMVGFQTKLKIPEQQRIFRSLPGLKDAIFARYGTVHRNTYVNAPKCLTPRLEVQARKGLYLAGQMVGVEGYVESAAMGFLAGCNINYAMRGEESPQPSPVTAHGALVRFLMESDPAHFQPMNVNYGLFPALDSEARKRKKREKNELRAARALEALVVYQQEIGEHLE